MAASLPRAPTWADTMTSIGVTGTNGKSSTTTFLARALDAHHPPALRATTLGYWMADEEIDAPRTWDGFVHAMRQGHLRGATYAAIELTSESLARGFARAWPFRVGVFTNLSHDHLDAHGSPEHYLASKAQLFLAIGGGGTAVLNAADEVHPLLREIVPQNVRVFTYGVASRGTFHEEPNVIVESVKLSRSGTVVALRYQGIDGLGDLPSNLTVRAPGEIYAENAVAAMLGAIAAGVPAHIAANAIAACPAPKGRFEIVHQHPCVVVDYAHTPDAIARTVGAARVLAKKASLTVVFGAGGHRDRDKRAPMGTAAAEANRVILTTDNARDEDPAAICAQIRTGLVGHPRVDVVLDRAAAITKAIREANPEDVVLVCGRGHETEQIVGAEARRFSDHDVIASAVAR